MAVNNLLSHGFHALIIAMALPCATSCEDIQRKDASLNVTPALPGRVLTWQHTGHDIASSGQVPESKVRRSNRYAVRVAPVKDGPGAAADSFVYMSVPRGGRQTGGDARPDGAEFAFASGLTMSWSTFLYGETVWLAIERIDGNPVGPIENVVIRPTNLDLEKRKKDDRTMLIRLPFRPEGYRFSVEFKDDYVTSYNDGSGTAGKLTLDPSGKAIHAEPRHALLIFAESFPSGPAATPTSNDGVIHYPAPGPVSNLHEIQADIIHFRPGVYWMPRNYHARLRDSVGRVHLDPGAYVKGAFEFGGMLDAYRVTGHGILSGELYDYEPDRRSENGHQPYNRRDDTFSDCHGTCLRLLQFYSLPRPQALLVHGITLANPPYHAVTIFGDEATMQTDFRHYKQIGGWYWQTDGVELFSGGSLENSFLHCNDDVIKLYHSGVSVSNVIVWKCENGPVFQWGWIPRSIRHVRVRDVDIIHNRMFWRDVKHNAGLFNSARHWSGDEHTANPDYWIEDMVFENIRSEGMNLAAMRFYLLSNWRDIEIRNLWIESWNELAPHEQASKFQPVQDARRTRQTICDRNMGLQLINYRVGNQQVTRQAGNWSSHQAGRLDFDAALWDAWDAR